jgi:hypothetical protein
MVRRSRLSRARAFFRKERLAVVKGIESRKLPPYVDTHHKSITVGEALQRIQHNRTYMTVGVWNPIMAKNRPNYFRQFEEDIHRVAPKATFEYLPEQWMIKNKLKDPFREVRISNVTVGQALEIGSRVSFTYGVWKG